MNEPTVITPEPTPATPVVDAPATPAQPTTEQLAEIQAKYDEAKREMYEKQRESADLRAKLSAEEIMRSTAQAQLAQFQIKSDPLAEAENRIKELDDAGDTAGARQLSRQVDAARSQQAVQAVAATGLLNTINQTLERSDLSPDAKAIIRERVFEGGDPKKNFRTDKFNELLGMAIKPGAWGEFVNESKEQAEGRKVLSGKTKTELFQEWTAESEKRKREAEIASSLTQGASGAPPLLKPEEQKVKDDAMLEKIINARRP